MEIVDLQQHEPAPFEDWAAADEVTRRRVLTEAMWQSMDAVGVHAVVLNPLEDPTWMNDLARQHPDRVAAVPGFHRADLDAPDIAARVAELYDPPGTVAIRLGTIPSLNPQEFDFYTAGGFDPVFAACERQGVPVWLEVMGGAYMVDRVARTFPDLQIILDHI